MRRKSFPSASNIRVGLIRRTGHGVLVLVQGCLVAVGYRWRHPDRWIRLTPDHRCRRRMLAIWSQNWNHQNWSHAIFDDESMVSPYHSDHRVREFRLFLGCENPLAFQQHGHPHCSCRGWLWAHQQIAHETSASGSRSGACVPTSGDGGDGQKSVWGIGLDVLNDI